MAKKKTAANKTNAKSKSSKSTNKNDAKTSSKKLSSKSSVHDKKVSVSVNSTDEYTKELKSAGKPSFFHYDSHPFVVGILTILLILFITAAILSYYSLTTTVDVIISDMNETSDTDVEDIVQNSVENTETESDATAELSSDCTQPNYIITCDSESPSNSCDLLSDSNISTQWLAKYSCSSRDRPCAVSNKVTITSDGDFNQVTLYNRIEKDFYINRMIVSYNNISETFILGAKYSQEPFTFNLSSSTESLQIHIVEIVGLYNRYLAGISELSVANTCN